MSGSSIFPITESFEANVPLTLCKEGTNGLANAISRLLALKLKLIESRFRNACEFINDVLPDKT